MFWKIVSDAAHELGFEAHPHDFRNKRASDLLNAGMRLEVLQEILGHSGISTTRKVYAHFDKPCTRFLTARARKRITSDELSTGKP